MSDMIVLDVVVLRVGGLGHPVVVVSHHERSRCTALSSLSEDVEGIVVERELGWGCLQGVIGVD